MSKALRTMSKQLGTRMKPKTRIQKYKLKKVFIPTKRTISVNPERQLLNMHKL